MKLEDLPDMPDPDPKKGMFVPWVAARDDAIRARLAYAKELLSCTYTQRRSLHWDEKRAAFIEKLNAEGL